jgi:hypothetical protein
VSRARVVKVAALPQYRLHVEFGDGAAGTVDLSGELEGECSSRGATTRCSAALRWTSSERCGDRGGPGSAPDAMHDDRAGLPP